MIFSFLLLSGQLRKEVCLHLIKCHEGFTGVFFHNSLIIQIMCGYFYLYFVLFITIKSDVTTAQKIVNNLINEK